MRISDWSSDVCSSDLVAPDEAHPLRAAAAVLRIALGAGAAAVINMWYERDLDALMAQTRRRPIPARRIAPANALAFGIAPSPAPGIAMAMVATRTAALLVALAPRFQLFVSPLCR